MNGIHYRRHFYNRKKMLFITSDKKCFLNMHFYDVLLKWLVYKQSIFMKLTVP